MSEKITVLAANLVDSPAAKAAQDDTKAAIYGRWLDADTTEEREKLHGMAQGAELYWTILEAYAIDGRSIKDGIEEAMEQSQNAID